MSRISFPGTRDERAFAPAPWLADLRAACAVFLVALPLSLGIAHAVSAPASAGLVAGAVGGLVVGALSGSQLVVSGPAAGLIMIAGSGLQQLGTAGFALAVALAGALQMSLGGLSLGRLAQFFPNSVVRGMVASIGLVLVLKQLPHALGYDADFEGDPEFLQRDGENTLSGLVHALSALNGGAVLVALCAAGVLLAWRFTPLRRLRDVLPGELAAVLAGTLVNEGFSGGPLELQPEHLLSLPHWSAALTPHAASWPLALLGSASLWRVALALAIVASLETLLCAEAVDKLDPAQRATPRDRELLAQGAGNLLCGLFAGLPITGVIVRSATNVHAGARTRRSTMMHGALLCLAVFALPDLLSRIPLASLAVVLIAVGGRLTRPSVYAEAWQQGWAQRVPFALTVLGVLFADMLVGVALGFGVALLFLVVRQYRSAVFVTDDGANRLIRLRSDLAFVHKPLLSRALEVRAGARDVVVDGSRVRHMDEDIIELLRTSSQRRGGRVTVLRNPANTHPFFRDEEPSQ